MTGAEAICFIFQDARIFLRGYQQIAGLFAARANILSTYHANSECLMRWDSSQAASSSRGGSQRSWCSWRQRRRLCRPYQGQDVHNAGVSPSPTTPERDRLYAHAMSPCKRAHGRSPPVNGLGKNYSFPVPRNGSAKPMICWSAQSIPLPVQQVGLCERGFCSSCPWFGWEAYSVRRHGYKGCRIDPDTGHPLWIPMPPSPVFSIVRRSPCH